MIYENRQAYKSQLKSRLYLIVFLHENGTKIPLSAALCFVNFYSHLFILLQRLFELSILNINPFHFHPLLNFLKLN